MIVDPQTLGAEESYKLLTGVVVPRPIAWVTTLNRSGKVNLAPFSAFTFVSPKPPMIGVSIGRKGDTYKDTAQNILSREEFVVNIADQGLTALVHASSEEMPEDVSECEALGIETAPSEAIATPYVTAAPVAMECRFRQCIEFGETRSRFIVGEILRFHIRDGLLRNGKITTLELNPICRLGGPNYATLGEVVTMQSVYQTPKTTTSEPHGE
jgi:flavin reductase (DIM6/NTAB) family NADH-FMN oxidoreductase RutF